jgi:arsenite methyltransferase
MNKNDNIRKRVSKDYAKAVREEVGCCGNKTQKGVVAKIAGYTEEELQGLPAEAVTNSFGCGNPIAFAYVKEGDIVLDLGSGAGIDLLLAAKKVGLRGKVIGVDMTDAMIEKAKENIMNSGFKNIEIRKGIIEELPVDSSSIDWVISNCVVNLSPEKSKVFAEIYRVLKPGGQLSISDIVAKEIPKEILENPSLYSSCISGAISEEEYIKGLEKAGIKNVKILDRLTYDETQLKGFIGSELKEGSCGCSGNVRKDLATKWSSDLAGTIASIRIYAQKP